MKDQDARDDILVVKGRMLSLELDLRRLLNRLEYNEMQKILLEKGWKPVKYDTWTPPKSLRLKEDMGTKEAAKIARQQK